MATKQPPRVILSAYAWPTNADLIADVAKLYVKRTWHVLDPTYGGGAWWSVFRPRKLTAHDLYTLDGVDFRQLPEDADTFDCAVFDPAYVVPGGRDSSTIKKMHKTYGMDTTEKTPQLQHSLVIAPGLKEITRVLKPRAPLFMKAQPYITSGNMYDGAQLVEEELKDIGYRIVDRFVHLGQPRAQEKGRTRKCSACKGSGFCYGLTKCKSCKGSGRIATTQQHSRNNYSMLLVARAPK